MENSNLTHNDLPKAVGLLLERLERIEASLNAQNSKIEPTDNPEQLLTIQEASEFLSLSVATIYSKVSKGELPVMKRSKRLYFSSTELLEYLKQGRKKSTAEIEQEAEAYLTNKKRLNNGK